MSYATYKVLHLMGIVFLFLSLGTTICLAEASATRANLRRLASITHGIALLLIIVAGFGLLAKLGLTRGLPPWAYAKLLIWVILGAAPFVVRKFPRPAAVWWFLLPVLGTLGAWLAIGKPF